MIRYAPLWKTMADRKVTTYTLCFKHGMSHATVQRLQTDMPVSTHTLDKLCAILDCRLEDIAEYVPDEWTALRICQRRTVELFVYSLGLTRPKGRGPVH